MARLMSSTELAARLEQDDSVILTDVRDPEEFEKDHIPGAVNIPLEALTEKAKEFKKSQRIIVYGETHADEASNRAAEMLEGMGFRRVSDFDGGVYAWKQAGYLTTAMN